MMVLSCSSSEISQLCPSYFRIQFLCVCNMCIYFVKLETEIEEIVLHGKINETVPE